MGEGTTRILRNDIAKIQIRSGIGRGGVETQKIMKLDMIGLMDTDEEREIS